jgi:hypothetical protein
MNDRALDRRRFLRVLGQSTALGAGAAIFSAPLWRALAADPLPDTEFFIFIHAAGGWDVTLWSDPRNERAGIIEPASTDNTDIVGLRNWTDAPLDSDTRTFAFVRPNAGNLVFGPAIGDLLNLADRLCIVNGIAMNTVSHPDGTAFSLTGRHLAGGRAASSSIDTFVANEMGRDILFPIISVAFSSSYVGSGLDPRVIPMRVDNIGAVTRSLTRSDRNLAPIDRADVTALLSREAQDLASRAYFPETPRAFSLAYDALGRMISGNLQTIFNQTTLQTTYPAFNYRYRFQGARAVNAAFAIEAMKRNVVRCVSFSLGGFDTHNANYRNHALTLQEGFDLIAALVAQLDTTPHPTLTSDKLADHTHILVLSEFCRTPQINLTGGRDHYPNNSALIISPRFRGGTVFGQSDREQLLPADAGTFADGTRPVAPPDVLATFLGAFGVDPRKYLRDGDVVRAILRS